MNRAAGSAATAKILTVLGLVAGLVGLQGAVAQAGVAQPSVVSANPAEFTPNVNDGTVRKVLQVGGRLYAGGTFTSVTKGQTFRRANLFSFDATTGAVHSFAPNVNGDVWALATNGTSLYVGGDFTSINGVARQGLAKLNLTTGAVDTSFNARLNGSVRDAVFTGGRLIVGGFFAKRLQAVNPNTGADTGYLNLGISGSVASNAGPTHVYRMAVNSAGTRLVAVGNFTTVGGRAHERAFMANLGAGGATVNAWRYAPLQNPCSATSVPAYLRDVDFAPNGSYFVLAAGGGAPLPGGIGRDVCDAAARFETGTASPNRPTWINYTGGDTLHSVTVTGAAVYVQGHMRWLDNPQGRNSAGPGAVSRPGIGAINPNTGLANGWNPTKGRGVGGMDLYATGRGLWVPSDTETIGGEVHKRIAFMPL